MNDAIRTFVDVRPIDLAKAHAQHAAYRRALEAAGARVVLLEGSVAHPDGVFVEDTAVVLDELAIVTSMGTAARRGETSDVEAELRRHRDEVARISLPATLEGGDVLRVGRTLWVGVTGRTNREGIERLAELARPHGYAVHAVTVTGCLHLKTACTALPDGTLLVNPAWLHTSDLCGAPLLHVPEGEPDAANVVVVGDRVILAAGHPKTAALVQARVGAVETVDLSEFAKAEGCGTCLSILVPTTRR